MFSFKWAFACRASGSRSQWKPNNGKWLLWPFRTASSCSAGASSVPDAWPEDKDICPGICPCGTILVGGSVPAHTALLCLGTARGLGGVRTSALGRMFQLWYNGRRVVSLCKANMDTMQQRFILHIDLDAFYAAIEQRDDPELRGKPVIVGGSPDRRGVGSTTSYQAPTVWGASSHPHWTTCWAFPHAAFFASPHSA